MTRYDRVKNLIENDREGFIAWVAVKMAQAAVGEEDWNRFCLARDRYKNWLRTKYFNDEQIEGWYENKSLLSARGRRNHRRRKW